MPSTSAGILLFRPAGEAFEVLLVHPGGPLWAKKDEGAWSIPKGEVGEGEEPLACALRELEEELGTSFSLAPEELIASGRCVKGRQGRPLLGGAGRLRPRRPAQQHLHDGVAAAFGVEREFPEVDRAEWFGFERAGEKINPAQAELLDRLAATR